MKDKIKSTYETTVKATSCDSPCKNSLAVIIPKAPNKTGNDTTLLGGPALENFPNLMFKSVTKKNIKIHPISNNINITANNQLEPICNVITL